MKQPSTFVLDSFALLAFFQQEVATETVEAILNRSRKGEARLLITTVNLGEVAYRILRRFGLEKVQEVLARIQEYAVEIVDVDYELALAAAYLKGTYTMGYADCFAAALSQQESATLVTGDPDFRQVEDFIPVEWLPVT